MKVLSIKILIVTFLSLSLLFVLQNFGTLPNKQDNGFSRIWSDLTTEEKLTKSINLELSKINGFTSSRIFFTSIDPGWAIALDYKLIPRDSLIFGLNPLEQLLSPITFIDSTKYMIIANNIPILFSGNKSSNVESIDSLRIRSSIITRATKINNSTIAIRGIDSTQLNQSFKIISTITGNVIKENHLLIPSNNDGGFSTDGHLLYDNKNNSIIYTQLYSNQWFCTDTNLNLKYKSRTIDTVFHNKVNIQVVNDNSTLKLMPINARQTINEKAFTFDGFLYIMSGLRADNESIRSFAKSQPIDIYSTKTGKYISSLQIARKQGKKVLDFAINENKIIVLYESGIITIFEMRHLSL